MGITQTQTVLLEDFRSGKGSRFWHVYEPHLRRMARRALGGIRDPRLREQEVEDLVAEIAAALFEPRTRRRYDRSRGGQFKAWLRGVVRNCALVRLKRNRRNLAAPSEPLSEIEAKIRGDSEFLELAWREWVNHVIRRALPRGVDAQKYQAFILCDVHHLPADEVARLLGIGVPSVRTYVSDVRRRLRQLLKDR